MASREQIARWLGVATSAENGAADIQRVSSVEDAGPDCAVFAAGEGVLRAAMTSKAGLILAGAALVTAVPAAEDARVMVVSDARLAFSELAARLAPAEAAGIHPSAVVDGDASLHPSVRVGAGAVVAAGVRMGAGGVLGPRVVVEAGVVMGERVRVQAGAVLGSLGFGYARRPDGGYVLFPQQGALVIEDDVEIGANSTIDRGALGETRIGAGTKIDNLVHVGHNCRIGRNVILAAQTGISGSTVVEDGAILGGQVGIGEHALVGPGVILGGGAGVLSNKKLYGAGQVFWGRPAQPLKQYLRDLARLRKGGV